VTRRGDLRPRGTWKPLAAGAALSRCKGGTDSVTARDGCEMPGEGEHVAPLAIAVKQCANPGWIAGTQRRLEVQEPCVGVPLGLFRDLEFGHGKPDVVHSGLAPQRVVRIDGTDRTFAKVRRTWDRTRP